MMPKFSFGFTCLMAMMRSVFKLRCWALKKRKYDQLREYKQAKEKLFFSLRCCSHFCCAFTFEPESSLCRLCKHHLDKEGRGRELQSVAAATWQILKPPCKRSEPPAGRHKPDKIINHTCLRDGQQRTKVDKVYKTTQRREIIQLTGDAMWHRWPYRRRTLVEMDHYTEAKLVETDPSIYNLCVLRPLS